jgi:hypothetical protein
MREGVHGVMRNRKECVQGSRSFVSGAKGKTFPRILGRQIFKVEKYLGKNQKRR